MTAFGTYRGIYWLKVSGGSSAFPFPFVRKWEPVYDKLIYQSPLNGIRNAHIRGYHWAVELDLLMFKSPSDTTRRAHIDQWLGWIGEDDFKLKGWSEQNYIEESNGTDALFTLEEATAFYWNSRRNKDMIKLKFYSNTYVQYQYSHP